MLIDLPKDVQNGDASQSAGAHACAGAIDADAPIDASLHAALALISQAQRPVLYGGGGIALGACDGSVPHVRRRAPRSRPC